MNGEMMLGYSEKWIFPGKDGGLDGREVYEFTFPFLFLHKCWGSSAVSTALWSRLASLDQSSRPCAQSVCVWTASALQRSPSWTAQAVLSVSLFLFAVRPFLLCLLSSILIHLYEKEKEMRLQWRNPSSNSQPRCPLLSLCFSSKWTQWTIFSKQTAEKGPLKKIRSFSLN